MSTQSVPILDHPDADGVRRAKRGELAAFAALFEAHKAGVYCVCLRLTHGKVAAEELTEKIFLRAFHRIADCHDERDFSVLVYRIALGAASMCGGKVDRTPLAVEPLLRLAQESVFSPRRGHPRVAWMPARILNVRARILGNHSWAGLLMRFRRLGPAMSSHA